MIVGVTGNCCTGKSAVMHILARLGFEAFYADDMVVQIYKEEPMVRAIGEIFGTTVTLGGKVDKSLLGEIVFNNQEKLSRLNSVVHPKVLEKIGEIKHKDRIVFVEMPLLFEAGFEKFFDVIVLVKCSAKTALERARNKGITETRFRQITAMQVPAQKVLHLADFVIDTEGNIEVTRNKTEEFAKGLKLKTGLRGTEE